MNATKRCLLLSFGVFFAACNLEGEDPAEEDYEDEEVGEARDAFSGYAGPAVVVASPNFDSDGGTVGSNTTAFLSSVAGHFGGTGLNGPYIQATVFGTTFEVEAYAAGNVVAGQGWVVDTGTSALPSAACDSDDGTTDEAPLTKPTGAGAGEYACFLTRVSSDVVHWVQWADTAEITYGLFGLSPKLKCTGYAKAEARCIPITHSYGRWLRGSDETPLSTSLGAVDWTNGKVCGLYWINGRFRTNSAGHGVAAYVNGSNWELFTDTETGAGAECVR